jgi:hypothetical protein
MRSRVLIGASAWLLGALTATGGSLYAVNLLGQGLLEQHSKQVSVAMVNAELALETSQHAGVLPSASPGPSALQASGTSAPGAPDKAKPLPSRRASASGGGAAARLLTSSGGTAEATCRNGLAHLLFWSPAQGFDVSGQRPGPASVASVTFTDSSGGVTMRVACTSSGVPVTHNSSFQWGGGTHHDE